MYSVQDRTTLESLLARDLGQGFWASLAWESRLGIASAAGRGASEVVVLPLVLSSRDSMMTGLC